MAIIATDPEMGTCCLQARDTRPWAGLDSVCIAELSVPKQPWKSACHESVSDSRRTSTFHAASYIAHHT
eukprot:3136652-Rhodomonas_salina.1